MTRQSQGVALKRAEEQAKARNRRRKLSLDAAKRIYEAREAQRAADNLRRLRAESQIARQQLGEAA